MECLGVVLECVASGILVTWEGEDLCVSCVVCVCVLLITKQNGVMKDTDRTIEKMNMQITGKNTKKENQNECTSRKRKLDKKNTSWWFVRKENGRMDEKVNYKRKINEN